MKYLIDLGIVKYISPPKMGLIVQCDAIYTQERLIVWQMR